MDGDMNISRSLGIAWLQGSMQSSTPTTMDYMIEACSTLKSVCEGEEPR